MSDHLKEVPPAAQLLGREIVSVDPQSGEVKLQFAARQEFTNRHGTVQGGMLAAMLDSATGNAVMAKLPPHLTAVTTRLDTQFSPLSWARLRLRRASVIRTSGPQKCRPNSPIAQVR
jgi:acyl-coenzyme A thioesterase PaaI-like protein